MALERLVVVRPVVVRPMLEVRPPFLSLVTLLDEILVLPVVLRVEFLPELM